MGCCTSDSATSERLLRSNIDGAQAGGGVTKTSTMFAIDDALDTIEKTPEPKAYEPPQKVPKAIFQQFESLVFAFDTKVNSYEIMGIIENNSEFKLTQIRFNPKSTHCKKKHIARKEVHNYPNPGDSVVHMAIRRKDTRLLYFLLAMGANGDDAGPESGETPMIVLLNSIARSKEQKNKVDLQLLAMLLDAGANDQKTDNKGRAPVTIALDEDMKEVNELFGQVLAKRRGVSMLSAVDVFEAEKRLKQPLVFSIVKGHRDAPEFPRSVCFAAQWRNNNKFNKRFGEWYDVYLCVSSAHIMWTTNVTLIDGWDFSLETETVKPTLGNGFLSLLAMDQYSGIDDDTLTIEREVGSSIMGKLSRSDEDTYTFKFNKTQDRDTVLDAIKKFKIYFTMVAMPKRR